MSRTTCPNCQVEQLKTWNELTEPEKHVIEQRCADRDPPLEVRQANALWCTNCWYESWQVNDVDFA